MKGLIFSFLVITSSLASAAQLAIVISKKAIIYADLEKSSPIGYVKKGKQLAVGEVRRRQGKLLPVNVNGKLAWIETKNLRLPSEEKSFDKGRRVTEHEVIIEEKVKDPLDQNNYLSLKTGPSQMNMSVLSSDEGEVSTQLESGQETTLLFEHRNPHLDYSWGLGLEFLTAKLDDIFLFQSLSFKGGVNYIPLHFKYFNTELYGNIVLSGAFQVESQDVGVYKGNLYGLDVGARLRFFPRSRFGVFAGVGASYYKIDGLDDIKNINNEISLKISSLNVTKVYGGLSYRF